MIFFIVWIGASVLVGMIAANRGRNGVGWFFLALLISPILAALLALALGEFKPPAAARPVASPLPKPTKAGEIVGDDQFRFQIVGESFYQAEIEAIVGGRHGHGANHYADAMLLAEPNNPYDPNAIAVLIEGRTVGYLSRDTAPIFKQVLAQGGFASASCEALIAGGWDRGAGDRGDFGVRLNARLPFIVKDVPTSQSAVWQVPESDRVLPPAPIVQWRRGLPVWARVAIGFAIFGAFAGMLYWNKVLNSTAVIATSPPEPALAVAPPPPKPAPAPSPVVAAPLSLTPTDVEPVAPVPLPKRKPTKKLPTKPVSLVPRAAETNGQ